MQQKCVETRRDLFRVGLPSNPRFDGPSLMKYWPAPLIGPTVSKASAWKDKIPVGDVRVFLFFP